MIHTCTRPAPVGSSGCCARNSGAVAIVATTSPPATPAATHSHEGSRVNASRAINTAAPTATNGMPSMPLGTQYAALVDLAIVTASANTSTADQRVEAGTAARARSHLVAGRSPSCRPPLGDTDCISRPHQPREVVALADDIEVRVLTEVECRVPVRAAEADGVDVEDDQRGAPAAHRLEQVHPIRVGARRDDRNRPPRQAAHAIPGKRLAQGRAAVRLSDRQVVEDEAVLLDRAVRLQECAARIVGDESHLAAATRHLCGHRGGEAHRIFDGRLLALADVHLAIEVEKDPDVGGQWLLESLRHEPVVVSRKRPVDAAEAVACHVVAHPAGLRRVVGPRTGRWRRTEVLRAGGHQVRDGTDARVYEY